MAVRIRFRRFYECDTESDRSLDFGADSLLYCIDTDKYYKIYNAGYVEVLPEDVIFTSPIPISKLDISGVPDGTKFLRDDGSWASPEGSGFGTVTTLSVVSANGFAGTVANPTSTPAITLSTTVNGLLKGNGAAISAASAGTDYQAPISLTTTGTSGLATFEAGVLNIPNYTYTLPTATTTILGGVKIDGTTITIDGNGVISSASAYTLPIASASVLGGVKIGSGVTIDAEGVISVSTNYQAPITLTTTGNSGASTFVSNTLNIPTYTLAGLGGFANPMTTLGDTIYGGASGAATRLAGNTTTAKRYLSQTGNGTVSAAPAWASIAGADITGAALTKTDDTNITLTLGGNPATSLLRAASLTLGWTGQLSIARGGTGLSALGTANQLLRVKSDESGLEYWTPNYLTAHPAVNAAASVDNSNGSVIQDLTFDVFGHVTAVTSYNLDGRYYTETEIGDFFAGTTAITGYAKSNWDTAYSWGNHALAGYQLASEKGAANGYASLDGAGKVPISQLPSSIMEYKGVWNASTNNPTLADGTGDTGDVYRVSVAGTKDLGSGNISFEVGDYVIYNGATWEKSDTTDAVASVNGKTGVVVLKTVDIAEDTNLYYTDTRARAAISLTVTGSSGASTYDNGTGILNIPTYTLSGLGGVPSTRTLTINGTAYDLSADRSWDIIAGHTIYDSAGTALTHRPGLKFSRLIVSDISGQTVVTRPSDTFIGPDKPLNPVVGDEWTDSDNWTTYKWYGNEWVMLFPQTGISSGNTTYSISAETATGGAFLRLTGSNSTNDDVKFASGTNISVVRTDANTITFNSTIPSGIITGDGFDRGVTYWTGPSTIDANANLIFNYSNGNLGIRAGSSPVKTLSVNAPNEGEEAVRIGNVNSGYGSVSGSTYFGLHHWSTNGLNRVNSPVQLGVIEWGLSNSTNPGSSQTASYDSSFVIKLRKTFVDTSNRGSDIAPSIKFQLYPSGQMGLPAYNSPSSFVGTPAGYLAFDNAGNIITSYTDVNLNYEQGTFTPILRTNGTVNFSNVEYTTNRFGKYTKIGSLVYFMGCVETSSVSGVGSANGSICIGGLPFNTSGSLSPTTPYPNPERIFIHIAYAASWQNTRPRSAMSGGLSVPTDGTTALAGYNSNINHVILYGRLASDGSDANIGTVSVKTSGVGNTVYFWGYYYV